MNRVLEDIQPKNVFRFFEDICNIPHGSGNVEKISRLILPRKEDLITDRMRISMLL